ncbi:hypothetical protein [uncultured Maritimibacter sp.]|jgi:hypothetical protein|uniref:hypothetical protein n=1 Tax=uncultured Maritimibacter sp. TaxID=991866 RepID=UPI0026031E7E|nr:hypothetical protein [uncultured Maritimibacter sp.]
MATEVEYGLTQIDMGDWIRGKDERLGKFIENQNTGFRVYFHYQHPIHDGRLRYIVIKNGFAMGFAVPAKLASTNSGGYLHRQFNGDDGPSIVVDTIGGTFRSDMCTETEHFPVLAAAEVFENRQQQDGFIAALSDAVPRIPALGSYVLRWNGGFGYKLEFTKSIWTKLSSGDFIYVAC